jgi:hypothetical protein
MRDTASPPDRYDEPTLYEIRIKGHLDRRWASSFDGLSFTHESDGATVLRGPVLDQAALHGLLRTVRDLALPLISVNRINRDEPEVAPFNAGANNTPSEEERDT